MSWIKTDIDFGMPWKRFVLQVRSVAGQQFHQLLGKEEYSNPGAMERAVKALILSTRPGLEGLIIIGMNRHNIFGNWMFEVIHPSFPRVSIGANPPTENLDLCPVCLNPMSYDGVNRNGEPSKIYTKSFGHPERGTGGCWVVCSEECSGEREDLPTPVPNATTLPKSNWLSLPETIIVRKNPQYPNDA